MIRILLALIVVVAAWWCSVGCGWFSCCVNGESNLKGYLYVGDFTPDMDSSWAPAVAVADLVWAKENKISQKWSRTYLLREPILAINYDYDMYVSPDTHFVCADCGCQIQVNVETNKVTARICGPR